MAENDEILTPSFSVYAVIIFFFFSFFFFSFFSFFFLGGGGGRVLPRLFVPVV